MKRNMWFAAFIILMMSLLNSGECIAQHYDFFYTCATTHNMELGFIEPQNGYVSIDFHDQSIVFHNLNDSTVVEFKHPEFDESSREWRLTTKQIDRDKWDGYIMKMDNSKKEVFSLSKGYTIRGENIRSVRMLKTMYKYPPFHFSQNLFLTCKEVVPAVASDIPNLRGDEYACFKQIINTPKIDDNMEVALRGNELVFTQKPYRGEAKVVYRAVVNQESLVLLSNPKHHGIYFNGPDKNDSSLSYEVFYGENKHLDMSREIMELMVYKNGVFQKIWFLGELYSDKENERDYKEWVPSVVSGCQRCKGTGKVVAAGICKRCSGRGYQKTTIYRSADQVVKRESHSDGSQTVTYLKQGYSNNVYSCDLCNGTGHKLETCEVCGGTGKIKTPGHN